MREPWRLQYLKSVFLEIPFVTTWSVFQNQVTYVCNNIMLKNCWNIPYYACIELQYEQHCYKLHKCYPHNASNICPLIMLIMQI